MSYKSSQVCRLLDVPHFRLLSAIRSRKLPAPTKDASGDFCWTDQDIENARIALSTDRRLKANRAKAVCDAS